jgi:hypothetical protein
MLYCILPAEDIPSSRCNSEFNPIFMHVYTPFSLMVTYNLIGEIPLNSTDVFWQSVKVAGFCPLP